MDRNWSSYFRIGLARVGRKVDEDTIKAAAKFADAAVREERRREDRDESPREVSTLVADAIPDASTKVSRADLRAALLARVERDADKWIDDAHARGLIDRVQGKDDLFELGIPF